MTDSVPLRRVVVVDDHELLRTGTRRILDAAAGFAVVGEAADGEAALQVVADSRPDVVLVDIRLLTGNGLDLARRITHDHPSVTVLILSAYDDEHYVRAALAAGASGYLLKTLPANELVRAIKFACEGRGFLGPSRSRGAPARRAEQAGPAADPPTPRELDVVRLVARGMSNKAIARNLAISPRTVEGHLNHVFEKLQVSSRTELVHYALANGMFVDGRAADPGAGPDPDVDSDPGVDP